MPQLVNQARSNRPEKSIYDCALLYLLYASPLCHMTSCRIHSFQAISCIDMPFCGGEKMTSGWAQRQAELLSGCIVSPHVFESIVNRLCDFVVPYQYALETDARNATCLRPWRITRVTRSAWRCSTCGVSRCRTAE